MTEARGFGGRLDRVRIPVRIAYMAVLFLATLSWFRIDADASAIAERVDRMLRPSVSRRDAIDAARNVVLFAGWGLLWMATAPAGRSWKALRDAVLTGAALSLLVESLQLLSGSRTASVLDLATNTAGATIGAILLVLVVVGLARRVGERSFVGVPASLFGLACGLAVAGEALVPLFRHGIEPWAEGGPLRRLSAALLRFRWGAPSEWPVGDLLLFMPAGALGVAALYETGMSYRAGVAFACAAAVVLLPGAEIAHGALGMEILGGAAVVHVVAASGGAAAAAWGLPIFSRRARGVQRPRLLAAVYASWLVLWAMRPYSPEPTLSGVVGKLTGDWWVPLRFLAARMDVFSVMDVTISFLLYLPVGGLLAVWPLRRSGALRGALPALYLAAATELGQLLVASRTLDVTDLLVQAAGAAVGWTIVRRAGFRPYGEQL